MTSTEKNYFGSRESFTNQKYSVTHRRKKRGKKMTEYFNKNAYGIFKVTEQETLTVAPSKNDGSHMTEKQLQYALDMAHALNIPYELTIKFSALSYEQGQVLIAELRREYNKITPATDKQKMKIKMMLICPEVYKAVGNIPIDRLTIDQANRLIGQFRIPYEEWKADRPEKDDLIKCKALYKRVSGEDMPPEIEGFLSKQNIDSVIAEYAREIGILRMMAKEEKPPQPPTKRIATVSTKNTPIIINRGKIKLHTLVSIFQSTEKNQKTSTLMTSGLLL